MPKRTLQVVSNVSLFERAWLPFVPYAIADDRLVTGQNPSSAKATAAKVAELL